MLFVSFGASSLAINALGAMLASPQADHSRASYWLDLFKHGDVMEVRHVMCQEDYHFPFGIELAANQ